MIRRTNPAGMHQPPGYHHVTEVQPGVTIHLAGQCPLDENGALVGGQDLAAQAEQVARNIVSALAAVHATVDDVIRATIYVVTPSRDELVTVWRALRGSDAAQAFGSAATLLGVTQLGFEGQRIEVDITAALRQQKG